MSTRQSSAPSDPDRGTLDWRPAVIITDTLGVVTYWNSAAERLYGWSATEAMGRSITELVVDPADLVIANDIVSSAAAGSGWEGRFPVRRKDGTTFVISAVDEALVDADGKTIGIIGISRSWVEAVAAPDGDRVLAAEHLVRNARGRAEAATRRLEHLQRIAAALSNLLSPDEVAEVTLTEVAPEMGGASQALWLLDETGQALRLVKVAESPRAAQFAEMPLGVNLPGARVVSTGQAIFVNSREERDRLFPTLSGLPNSASFAVLPLAAGGAVAGILATAFDDDHTFEPEERRFLTAVADLAAQAMERARLHATEMRAAERLAFLAEASATLSSSLDYQETLAHVVRLMVPRVADVATVHLVGEDAVLRRVALAHRDPEREADLLAYQAEQGPEIRNPALAAAAVRGETTREVGRAIGELAAVDEVHAHLVASLDITSNITAPLVSRGETIGVLNLLRTGDSPPYQADDQALAEELARRAAVAFDNARMHERRTEVARLLQASLLPPELPSVPHADLAAAYHPAGQGIEAGGDFYDLFPLPGGRWALMIGDVCGTGPVAAALTAQVRHTARAIAGTGAGAVTIVGTVNDALAASADDERFCTMVLAILTPAERGVELEIVSAGHPSPMIVRAGGDVTEVSSHGVLVGVFAGARHESHGARLDSGDALVLYTDGVIEARSVTPGPGDKRGFFESERLAGVLRTLAGHPAEALVSGIEGELMQFAGGRLADDVAIVALRATPCR